MTLEQRVRRAERMLVMMANSGRPKTDEALRAFINSLRKGHNESSSRG